MPRKAASSSGFAGIRQANRRTPKNLGAEMGKTFCGIFQISRYAQGTRHLVAIGIHAEKEVIQ